MAEEVERDNTPEADEAASEPAVEAAAAAAAEDAESAPQSAAEAQAVTAAEGAADQEPAAQEPAEEDIEVSFEVTEVGPCRRKIAVTVGREVIDKEMEKQFSELSRTVVTPGFRKGRAPRRILQRRYGKALTDGVKQSLAARGIQKSITEADLAPVGEPDIGEIVMEEGGPLTVEATMDVRPTVNLEDYTGLEITKRAVSVGEKEIDRAVRSLLERRGRLVPVVDPEATVDEDDLVVCDYRVTCGERTLVEQSDVTVPVRLPHFPEVPEVGSERLLGAKAQGSVETAFELADEKWPEDLRGRSAVLSVTVHEIKRVELPELTEEVLQDLGAGSEDDLRARIEIMLLRDLEREVQREMEQQLERQLLEQADFVLPESLVAEQAARSAERARLRMMELGLEHEAIEERSEELAEASRTRAERDLKMYFILEHIADREKITAEPRDLEERMARIAASYGVSPRQARLWLEKDDAIDGLRLMIREQKVTDWLLEHAQVTELEPEVDVTAAAPDGT